MAVLLSYHNFPVVQVNSLSSCSNKTCAVTHDLLIRSFFTLLQNSETLYILYGFLIVRYL